MLQQDHGEGQYTNSVSIQNTNAMAKRKKEKQANTMARS
jgi:hypothetical protein